MKRISEMIPEQYRTTLIFVANLLIQLPSTDDIKEYLKEQGKFEEYEAFLDSYERRIGPYSSVNWDLQDRQTLKKEFLSKLTKMLQVNAGSHLETWRAISKMLDVMNQIA